MIVGTLFIVNGFGVEGGTAHFVQWDAVGYVSIAEHSYQVTNNYVGEGSRIAYFPLYPLIVGLLKIVTGFDTAIIGYFISFVFGLASAVMLYKMVLEWKGKETAEMAVLLLSFYPASVFLSSVYTESLFLFITLLTLYLLEHSKLKTSIVTVALSCVARVTGSVLGLIFAWEVWQKTRSIPKLIFYSLLAGIPFMIYLTFQYVKFGTPFAFLQSERMVWGQYAVFPWVGFWDIIDRAFWSKDNIFMWRMELVYILFMIYTLVVSVKKVPRRIWLFGFGVVFITLCGSWPLGIERYMLLVLPFYFYWAEVLAKRRLASQIVLAFSAGWMVITTALFILAKFVF